MKLNLKDAPPSPLYMYDDAYLTNSGAMKNVKESIIMSCTDAFYAFDTITLWWFEENTSGLDLVADLRD
jgi:hypothetical protein